MKVGVGSDPDTIWSTELVTYHVII